MSIRIMAMVWDSELPSMDRLVLLAVADFCDDGGKCWPSIDRIAKKCGMTDRGVRKILRRLEECGWLETDVGGGRHGCSQYTVKPGTTFPPEPRSPRNTSAETRNTSAENPEPCSPEPSRTINNRHSNTAREILCSWASPNAVDSFMAYRRKHKRGGPLTETAATRLAASLREIFDSGGDTDDALGMAEERGWISIKPDWYFNAKGRQHGKPTGDDPALRTILNAARSFEA